MREHALNFFSALFRPRFNARNIWGERERERSIMHPLPLSFPLTAPVPLSLTLCSLYRSLTIHSFSCTSRVVDEDIKWRTLPHSSCSCFFCLGLYTILLSSPPTLSQYPCSYSPYNSIQFSYSSQPTSCVLCLTTRSASRPNPPTLTTKFPHSAPTFAIPIQYHCTYTLRFTTTTKYPTPLP